MFRRRAVSAAIALGGAWRLLALAACLAFFPPMFCNAGDTPAQTQAAGLSDGSVGAGQGDYVIGPEDKLRIRVFEIKGLESDVEQVDSQGQIQLPLVGRVLAAGKTVQQLQDEIAERLNRYLQAPEVSVDVEESASQKVTVEGEVKSAGVFQMKGRTTLMEAIAMAGGLGDNANAHRVAVIRETNGVRSAAMCDYGAIRSGRAPDPVIEGNDIVVVDTSAVKSAWSDVLKTLPVFSLFAYLR